MVEVTGARIAARLNEEVPDLMKQLKTKFPHDGGAQALQRVADDYNNRRTEVDGVAL